MHLNFVSVSSVGKGLRTAGLCHRAKMEDLILKAMASQKRE